MMRLRLIQVLARLDSGRCGVSDHATALARELISEYGIETIFIAVNSRDNSPSSFPLVVCSPENLANVCGQYAVSGPCSVLVHVSGYGYSPDGVPWKLANAVREIQDRKNAKIASYFHELFYAGKKVWKKAFWVSYKQKSEVIKIAEKSDAIYTNTASHAEWIQSRLRSKVSCNVQVLPVFSTVGEPLSICSGKDRNRSMVVFGLESSRKMSYKILHANENALTAIGVHQIIDVGPGCANEKAFTNVAVDRLGQLSIEDLSSVLLSNLYGFVPHEATSAAKSSILAAYCAYGVIPIMPHSFYGNSDGLKDGCQVMSLGYASGCSSIDFDNYSCLSRQWYLKHDIKMHAKKHAEWVYRNHQLYQNPHCAITVLEK
jgi:hypothetical protein